MKEGSNTQGVAINGHKLHEISMVMVPYSTGTISILRYPKHRIQHAHQAADVILMVPAFLALALYHQGILPHYAAEPVEIAVSGKRLGAFCVAEVCYPHWDHEAVRIVLRRSEKTKEP
jgi:hypothetical protein